MQNKEEKKKRTTNKPAKKTTKALGGSTKANSTKALPAAKAGSTPIARLMAAASRSALPGDVSPSKGSGSTKGAGKTGKKKANKTAGKNSASAASKTSAAKKPAKGKATANANGKKATKPANGKETATKKQPKASSKAASSNPTSSKGTTVKKAAQGSGASTSNAGKASKTATQKTAKTQANTSAKAKSNTKGKTGTQKGTNANGKAKAGDKAQGTTKTKANGGTKTKSSGSAKGKANGSAKAKAGGSAKAKANGSTKAKSTAKKGTPAHAAPEIKRTPIETIRALPSTISTRAVEAKDWTTKKGRLPLLVAVVAIFVIYVIGSLVFSNVYLPGTTVNGNDASMRSAAALTAEADEASKDYKLNVSGDGADFSLASSDIDFAFDVGAYERNAKSHLLGWAWPVGIFLPKDFAVLDGVTFNRDAVQSAVDSAIEKVNKNATAPKNATISYDSGKKTFVVNNEQGGTAVSSQNTMDAVCKGIGELKSQVTLGDAELQQPAIKADSEQMGAAVQKANEISNKEIALTVNGNTVKTVNAELIHPWLKVDESYNVVADLDLVTDWAKSDLSREVDTVGTARTYTRTNDGKRIDAIGGGSYGWNMDGAKLAQSVCEHIANGSTESIEIPMQSKGEVYVHGKQDWGPRYVDVDLAEQYVRMFDENSNIVMESSCVSGNLAENNETVTGVFYLEKKESPATLVGLDENGDGEPDYENEVQFWMPFYGGYGLHDALWRSYFGEDLYKYDGSHGCVNLPYYAAEQLYDLIRVGDPVVVHY